MPGAALACCPCNGPGPGEVLVGMDNTTPPPTPLCGFVGKDPACGSDPGGYWGGQYATLVWVTDQTGGPPGSWPMNASRQAEADNGTLAQCQVSGFRDCRIAMSETNGAIAVAIDNGGSWRTDWGKDARPARKKALRFGKRQGAKGCKIETVIESPSAWVSNQRRAPPRSRPFPICSLPKYSRRRPPPPGSARPGVRTGPCRLPFTPGCRFAHAAVPDARPSPRVGPRTGQGGGDLICILSGLPPKGRHA